MKWLVALLTLAVLFAWDRVRTALQNREAQIASLEERIAALEKRVARLDD